MAFHLKCTLQVSHGYCKSHWDRLRIPGIDEPSQRLKYDRLPSLVPRRIQEQGAMTGNAILCMLLRVE